jgi:formamidopyrimidine-DNA glycosylase
MPELPEVETIVRDLRQYIVGRAIKGARFANKTVWRQGAPPGKALAGAVIEKIDRRGKNILIRLSNNRVMITHLGMTGRLTYNRLEDEIKRHTHLLLDLDLGQIRFNDPRRFGYLDLVNSREVNRLDYISALGPDALSIPRQEFIELIRSKRRIIKSLLLDQSVLAGMGNIYSDEALFMAGIHPRRVSATLSKERAGRLHEAMITVLNRAIGARGSSMNDYVDARGEKGSFQNQHQVYGREGKPCKRCGRRIKREVIGSRSAHFCAGCQK